jgi:hypothetical protein
MTSDREEAERKVLCRLIQYLFTYFIHELKKKMGWGKKMCVFATNISLMDSK